MRNLFKVSLCLGLVALLASPAFAQRPQRQRPQPGGPGRGFDLSNPTLLLTQKVVQDDLKIAGEQKEKLQSVLTKSGEKMRALRGNRDLSQEERGEKMRALQAETTKGINEVLKPEQQKRLKQIQLQVRGIEAAINDPEVQKALKFTDEQKEAVKTILKERDDKYQAETKDLERQDFRKRGEIRQKLNKEAQGKIASKLTSEQKEAWTEMIGEKIEVRFEFRRPGGDRPQRRPDF